jgi:hypothetical protein
MGVPDYYAARPDDFWVLHAYAEVQDTYGDTVRVKPKSLLKFGENLLVDTGQATVMTLPSGVTAETYVSDNLINRVSSSDDGDTQTFVVEGHTVDGSGNLTFSVQTGTLTGQAPATLTTPLARATRIYNTGATNWAGSVYVHEVDATISSGVPQATAKIHLIGPAGENQSLKASTSLSKVDYAFVTEIYASINKKTAGTAVIRFRVRNKGGVFRTLFKRAVASTGSDLNFEIRPFLIIPPNTDVMVTAEADAGSTAVAAGFNSILATKQT